MSSDVWKNIEEYKVNVYWVTVGKGLENNFDLGIKAETWGVKECYKERLSELKEGDYVLFYLGDRGFALSEVLSELFEEKTKRIWQDDYYPYRIKISKPFLSNNEKGMSNVYDCLRDKDEIKFESPQAAGRSIGGASGVFRRLRYFEVKDIFSKLGWGVNNNEDEFIFEREDDNMPAWKIKNDDTSFGISIERDLHKYLEQNIRSIKADLELIGSEYGTKTGRIDLLAKDSEGIVYVIELKPGKAPNDALAQILGYMGALEEIEEFKAKKIVGIIVANDFDARIKYACKKIPQLTLKRYKIEFTFEDSVV